MSDAVVSHLPEENYPDLRRQTETAVIGMWVFLSTEFLFFGGLLVAYIVLRTGYPAGFAEAGRETKVVNGTINTIVLLTSSFVMSWAIETARVGNNRLTFRLLVVTGLLGTLFLGLKGLEYAQEFQEHLVPGIDFARSGPNAHAVELFYFLYFCLTGLHSLHLLTGIGIVGWVALGAWRRRYTPQQHVAVVVSGLYWHFVDVVWLFLYPLIYLTGRHG